MKYLYITILIFTLFTGIVNGFLLTKDLKLPFAIKYYNLVPKEVIKNDSFKQGQVIFKDDLPIVVLSGNFYEMGLQYGYLRGKRTAEFLDFLSLIAKKETTILPSSLEKNLRRFVGSLFYKYFTPLSKKFLNGVVEGAKINNIELDIYDLAFINSLIDIAGIGSSNLSLDLEGFSTLQVLFKIIAKETGIGWYNQGCNSFAAFNSRTKDQKTYQTRNTDVEIGMGLEFFKQVLILKPSKGNAVISTGYTGQIGIFSGMNEKGIGLGQIWAFSSLKQIGTPWSISMLDTFVQSNTAKEASVLFPSFGPRTYGNNLIFADMHTAFAIEFNAEDYVVIEANTKDDIAITPQGIKYSIELKDAIVRADIAHSPIIRKNQTNAGGLNGNPTFSNAYKLRYKGQIDLLQAYERSKIKISVKEAEIISRLTASRNDGNLQNAVYENNDLKLLTAYSAIEKPLYGYNLLNAYENKYIFINFGEYLNKPHIP